MRATRTTKAKLFAASAALILMVGAGSGASSAAASPAAGVIDVKALPGILVLGKYDSGTIVYRTKPNGNDMRVLWKPPLRPESLRVNPPGTRWAAGLPVNRGIWLGSTTSSTGQVRLTSDTSSNTNPTWSRDGKTIAFSSNRIKTGYRNVFTLKSTRPYGAAVDLTHDGITCSTGSPLWRPGSNQIAVWTDCDRSTGESPALIDGTTGKILTRFNQFYGALAIVDWSNDGSIAIVNTGSSTYAFYPTTGKKVRLDTTGRYVTSPRISPDGKYVAFWDGDFDHTLQVMRIDGTGQTALPITWNDSSRLFDWF
jgi:Tol biopolymer transport system component